MASYGMNDVKNGMKIMVNNDPCIITDTEYVKPGKGQAFTRVKYRIIKTGRVVELTMKATDSRRSRRRGRYRHAVPVRRRRVLALHEPGDASSRCRPTRPAWATPRSGSRARRNAW